MIDRASLGRAFPDDPRLQRAFEEQAKVVEQTAATVSTSVAATEAINDATVLVLSSNAAFTNERVVIAGQGIDLVDDGANVTIKIRNDGAAEVQGGFGVILRTMGVTDVILPMSGTLATRAGAETLQNKTLAAPLLSGLGSYANDAAAAVGGVPVGGTYRNGSQLMVRVT